MSDKQAKNGDIFSKSFLKGFASGFASPANLVFGRTVKRPAEFDGSVERAWRSVGDSLASATRSYGDSIGQSPARPKKRRSRAAA